MPPAAASGGHDLIVIGGSAGAIPVIQAMLRGLPADLPAAVLVVLHQAQTVPGMLPQILSQEGPLPAKHAEDGEPIVPGTVYVSPPDRHLLVELTPDSLTSPPGSRSARTQLRLSTGAKENRFRPAIDPLFRTAARAYGRRLIGVILSGLLDDGTLGLMRVKQFGGVTVVQDPADALCGDMPASAIKYAPVDHVVSSDLIAALLVRLVGHSGPVGRFESVVAVPPQALPNTTTRTTTTISPLSQSVAGQAQDIVERGDNALTSGTIPGPPVGLTCPDCGGAIWEQTAGRMLHFRCHVGHQFTADTFAVEQSSQPESTLWAALRMFQEKAALHRRMAESAETGGDADMAIGFRERAVESAAQTEVLRRLPLGEPPSGGR